MRIRCPHCTNAIEIVDAQETPTACPSCGSRWTFLDETASYRSDSVQRLAHFELLEILGQGHFGEVWKARDAVLDRIVALKIPRTTDLDHSTRQLFLREARAAAQLRHPNIVAVHEVGVAGEQIYIVSDYIDGATLADLSAAAPLSTRRAVELCTLVAQALQHAHERGVIHRDIKPQNILVDTCGQPHVTDFGLAKREAGEITMTASGHVLGTCAYMPPEQARGDAHEADARSDVYSLGVVLYQLLVGRRPFEGGKRVLLYQVIHDEPPPLRKFDSRVPRDLETICLKALEKSPDRRYPSAQEMAADLQRFLDGHPIHARRASQLERGWRWTRRNPAWAAAISGFALLGLVLAMVVGREIGHRHEGMRYTTLATDPSGAQVAFIPLDAIDGTPHAENRVLADTSPVSCWLKPGDYLVVAWLDDGRFHEVLRHVPDSNESPPLLDYRHRWWNHVDGGIVLKEVEIPSAAVPQGMASLPGAESFEMGSSSEKLQDVASLHSRRVPAFYLDTTEVTVSEFARVTGQTDWRPSCLDSLPPSNHAVICVNWDQAVAFAESAGKRLPTEAEFEYAATDGGKRKTVSDSRKEWTYGPVGVDAGDRCDLDPLRPIFGIFSGVAEWTVSRFSYYPKFASLELSVEYRQYRIIRGGPYSVVQAQPKEEEWRDGPCYRLGRPVQEEQPGLGFRCARSARPRLEPDDFDAVLTPAAPKPGTPTR